MPQAPTHPLPSPTRAPGAPPAAAFAGQDPDDLLTWLVIGLGLTSLYFPTLWDLMHEQWGNGLHGHSLFVLVASLGLLRRAWPCLRALPPDRRHAPLAYATLLAASCFYALGRSQDIPTFEAGSGAFMVAGCTLLLRGAAGVRLHWFTLVFMLMAVPLPVEVTDRLTPVMQDLVCATTVQLLQWANLAARCNTVSLWVLSHELPLSYAVPGLTTLASLLAGLALYLHLMPTPAQRARWAPLLLLSPLIVLLACSARPVTLAWLSTQAVPLSAPWSQALGMVVPYACAAALVLLVDLPVRLLGRTGPAALPDTATATAADLAASTVTTASPGRTQVTMRELTHGVLAACLMMTGSLLSQALTPTLKMTQQIGEPRFGVMVPAQLGAWASVQTDLGAVVDPQTRQPGRRFNTEVLKRIYARPQGDRVMLLATYAPDLGRTLHAYRPPVLYPAQGWVVRGQRSDDLELPAGRLPVHRLEAARDSRQREAVTYWQLVGTQASRGALHGLLIKFGYSSDNIDPDGLILRVSSPLDGGITNGPGSGTDPSGAYALHDEFIRALLEQLKPEAHERLSGLAVLPTPNPPPAP